MYIVHVHVYQVADYGRLNCCPSSSVLHAVDSNLTLGSDFSFEKLLPWDLVCIALCLSQVSETLPCTYTFVGGERVGRKED